MADALSGQEDLSVASVEDAVALAAALASIRLTPTSAASLAPDLHALVGLLQEIDGEQSEIVGAVHENCLPEAQRLVDELIASAPDTQSDLLLFLLKVLSLYGGEDAAERVMAAVRIPVAPDAYMWSVIFRIYNPEHPQRDMLLRGLSDPLPSGFAGIALLDAVNEGLIAGETRAHPFDSEQGKARLRRLLMDPDPGHASYAISVTADDPRRRDRTAQAATSAARRAPTKRLGGFAPRKKPMFTN